ncbi:hypothetical protein CLOM_g14519 [Closterium sp. NIES-68]|nr:hypothetical protein CLOM_g14519 [Closterium sp. NIES-68]
MVSLRPCCFPVGRCNDAGGEHTGHATTDSIAVHSVCFMASPTIGSATPLLLSSASPSSSSASSPTLSATSTFSGDETAMPFHLIRLLSRLKSHLDETAMPFHLILFSRFKSQLMHQHLTAALFASPSSSSVSPESQLPMEMRWGTYNCHCGTGGDV